MDLAIDQRSFGNRWSLDCGVAGWGLKPVSHIARGKEFLVTRRAGKIVTENGQLRAVYGRWWPHAGNLLQVLWDINFRSPGHDRCQLFYHQPRSSPGFLSLGYIHSGPRTSLATFYAATLVLDEIARLKAAQAVVCHVTNSRITDRLLERWGWEAHCPNWSGRHFIKRFYGEYPSIAPLWRQRLRLDC
jgi:hypothetical protein